MLKESIARRYSAALYSLAKEAGAVERVVGEIDACVAALSSDRTLMEFFNSPVIDRGQKLRLLQASFEGRMTELCYNFLIVLVRKRREYLLPTIAAQLHELLDLDSGRSPASIITPMQLSPNELAELAGRLSAVYKRTIVPEPKVEPRLLGGVVVQVGDRYVDASVSGKLEEVRRHLLTSLDTWGTTSPNGKTK